LAEHSPLRDIEFEFVPAAEQTDANVGVERLDDILTSLIEGMAGIGVRHIRITTEVLPGQVMIRLSSREPITSVALGKRRLDLYNRALGWLGGSLECSHHTGSAEFVIRVPALRSDLLQVFTEMIFRYALRETEWRRGGRIDFKGSHFEKEIILWGVRWYVAYPISYRQLEEMMGERGVTVAHSTLNRWVIKYAPEVEKQFRRRQRSVGRSWRLDETYVKIKGKWDYLYRTVDKAGHTIDFLLTPHRDRAAAEAFLRKAIRNQGLPEKITIDQSGSNTAAIKGYNQVHKTAIVIRHSTYLNNLVEQDHRAVKRLTRPMLGFKSFWPACCTIAGVEVRHAIRQGQLIAPGLSVQTPAAQFYALAA
jgi:putative transposase